LLAFYFELCVVVVYRLIIGAIHTTFQRTAEEFDCGLDSGHSLDLLLKLVETSGQLDMPVRGRCHYVGTDARQIRTFINVTASFSFGRLLVLRHFLVGGTFLLLVSPVVVDLR
jgi:hypothetical protein